MRSIHRWVMTLAVVLLAFLAVTGIAIQLVGIRALLGPNAGNAAEIASIREGPAGVGNFTRMDAPSAFARPLPDGDLQPLLSRALAVARSAAPAAPVLSVELRVIGRQRQVVLQLGSPGDAPWVFDLDSGQRISGPAFPGDRMGAVAPRSSYGRIKGWHELNMFGSAGLWIDGALALSLMALSVTGLVLYLQLYRRRRQIGRGGLFWN